MKSTTNLSDFETNGNYERMYLNNNNYIELKNNNINTESTKQIINLTNLQFQ